MKETIHNRPFLSLLNLILIHQNKANGGYNILPVTRIKFRTCSILSYSSLNLLAVLS
jgi:hypothetical protein